MKFVKLLVRSHNIPEFCLETTAPNDFRGLDTSMSFLKPVYQTHHRLTAVLDYYHLPYPSIYYRLGYPLEPKLSLNIVLTKKPEEHYD